MRLDQARPISALLAAFLLGACSEAPRVGVVDVQAAYQHSPLLLVSTHEIKKELGNTEREIKQRGRELAQLRQLLAHGDVGAEPQRLALAQRIEQACEPRRAGDRLPRAARGGAQARWRVDDRPRRGGRAPGRGGARPRSPGAQERSPLPARGRRSRGVDVTADVARALLAKINPTFSPTPSRSRNVWFPTSTRRSSIGAWPKPL